MSEAKPNITEDALALWIAEKLQPQRTGVYSHAILLKSRAIARRMLAALDDGAVGKLVAAARLKRNTRLQPMEEFEHPENWVCVPVEDFTALREALKPFAKEGA